MFVSLKLGCQLERHDYCIADYCIAIADRKSPGGVTT
jgi:hypothetical protein